MKRSKLVYFGANLEKAETQLDEIGEYFEKMGYKKLRGNNGKISHSAVIALLIESASNEIKAKS